MLPLAYQWFRTGAAIADATNDSWSELSGTNGGETFWVVVTNQYGAVTSAPALLTVDPVAPRVTWHTPAGDISGTVTSVDV